MKPLYALYGDPARAGRAVQSLRDAGVDPRKIVVISSAPMDVYEWARPDRPTRMGWLAALGGVLGAASGCGLTALTQLNYPIVTGGMPVLTGWTNGIIIYELTMLGAILATLVTLLVSTRLPNWRPQLYDPEVSRGKILVGLTDCPDDARPKLTERLRQDFTPPS